MPTYLTFMRLGRLIVTGGISIDDLARLGEKHLRMIPLESGIYNVFIALTGGRPQPFVARIHITKSRRPPTMHHYERTLEFDIQSGFLALGDYTSMLLADANAIALAHRLINRSHLRIAMLMVDELSERVEWDLGRIAVVETGYGPGKCHLYYGRRGIAVSFIKGTGNGISSLERL